MYSIGVDESEATTTIVNAASNLPIGMSLGHILAVTSTGILTRDAIWGYNAEKDRTWRLVSLRDGLCEETRWRHGEEVGRLVFRTDAG
ncbi:hypothetical protein [Actinoplanes sp. NPDC026623]|uniref:hypothetical protein n=1 Tax=Actinoplanes sp. NPDC026623 TaxID=3155610 RepID=UPI0033F3E686